MGLLFFLCLWKSLNVCLFKYIYICTYIVKLKNTGLLNLSAHGKEYQNTSFGDNFLGVAALLCFFIYSAYFVSAGNWVSAEVHKPLLFFHSKINWCPNLFSWGNYEINHHSHFIMSLVWGECYLWRTLVNMTRSPSSPVPSVSGSVLLQALAPFPGMWAAQRCLARGYLPASPPAEGFQTEILSEFLLSCQPCWTLYG